MSWFKSDKKEHKKLAIRQNIVWFEIPASDFFRATVFYYKVFGFKIEELQVNGLKHGFFQFKEGQVKGAIVESTEEIKSGTILFFDANPSMREIEKRIIENGGEILVSKTLIKNQVTEGGDSILPNNFIDGKDIGYFAYFKDSEGNKMGLYANS